VKEAQSPNTRLALAPRIAAQSAGGGSAALANAPLVSCTQCGQPGSGRRRPCL